MVRLFPFPEIRVQLLPPTKAKQVAEYAKNIFRFVLFFDKILIAPFPFVYHALRADQKLSSRALSMSFLVVGFVFLPDLFDEASERMWTYKLPIEISLFLGYFMARVGWHEVAALLTALVLTVEYHYSVSLLPKVFNSITQLNGLFIPFMLLVITNHWLIVLLFYFTNVFMFIYYLSTYPPQSGVQLEVNLIAVVISMMLYSSCAHNFNHWLLKQNEQRYVQFFRENFEAIAVVDWQGIIREVNQSFAVLFSDQKDITTSEFVERSIFEFIDAENRPQVAKMFLSQGETIQFGELPRLEINGLRLDGQVIRVQAGLKMLRNFHGFSSGQSNALANSSSDIVSKQRSKNTTVFMLSFHDLTAHHQAQAAIVEAEREKHANDAKSKFLANMSHEIRTPLNGVLGMLQLLEDTPLNKEQRQFLKNSVDSANYLLLLINDILDFSKIEAGLLPIDEYEFKLAECIESVVDLLHSNARTKGVDLYAFVSTRCPPTILGDAARLRQVLMNLVSNAIKFTTKGKVLVNCDVEVDDVPPNSLRLKFHIIDTGIGLKPEYIERLFQRFYQVDDHSPLRRNHGGTGLGLAISRNLVGLMGGEIGVSSKYGEGSTFWFTLTCKKATPLSPSLSPDPLNPSNSTAYADLPPQQLQHQLQQQLQKELHYQLHQQQSAAQNYSDMTAKSQLGEKQQLLLLQQQHSNSPPLSHHHQQAQQHSPQVVTRHPLAASGSYPDIPTSAANSPSLRSPPSFSFVPTRFSTIDDPLISTGPLLNVSIIVVSDNPHTRGILWEYFQAWGYAEVTMYKALSEGVQTILEKRDEERKLIVILCNKGTHLDSVAHDHVVDIKKKMPGDFPFFVLFIDKGNIKTSIPKAILPQATLCYPIRQTQLFQVIMDIRDPSKHFAAHSPSLKNGKEKGTTSMPRVLYVDSSSTSRLMVKQTLQNDGIFCEAVASCSEAISSITSLPSTTTSTPKTNSTTSVNNLKLPFDIVLMDIGSSVGGDVNCSHCVEELRNFEKKTYYGTHVPIIGVTADPTITLHKALEGGMDGMCNFGVQQASPFSDVLLSIVRQWLQQAPRFSLGSTSYNNNYNNNNNNNNNLTPSSSYSSCSSSSSTSTSSSQSSSSPSYNSNISSPLTSSPTSQHSSPLNVNIGIIDDGADINNNNNNNSSPKTTRKNTNGNVNGENNNNANNSINNNNSSAVVVPSLKSSPSHQHQPLPQEQKRILVVEDNAMNQIVVSTFLKKAGYAFEFASDGQQGVDMYTSNPFGYHLILMDCQMPVMDGYEASIRIRQDEVAREIRAIPIVAMTAAALVVDRERCLAVGMSDFVQKPIQRPLFLEILAKWLKITYPIKEL